MAVTTFGDHGHGGGGVADHIHPEPQSFIRRYIFSIDHKIIGIQYIITAFLFMVMGGLLAELIRVQLMNAHGTFVKPDTFNELYSIHGSTMVWLVIIPMLTGGYGNFVFPLQIGANHALEQATADSAPQIPFPGLSRTGTMQTPSVETAERKCPAQGHKALCHQSTKARNRDGLVVSCNWLVT